LELQRFAEEAIPAIEEVMAVTVYNDIRQACLEAIRSLVAKKTQNRKESKAAAKKLKKKHIARAKKRQLRH
jgi:hypothetical protein